MGPNSPGQARPRVTLLGLLSLSLLVLALFTFSCTQAGLGATFTGWGGPVVSGDRVYLPSKKGTDRANIVAFDTFDGLEQGRFTARGEPEAIYGTPVVEGGILYTTSVYTVGGSQYGRVHAVILDNLGVGVWEFPAQGQDTMGPVFGGVAFSRDTNTIYVGSDDGKLYALKAEDGTAKKGGAGWIFDARSPIWSTPVVSGGTVYFGTMGGTLFGIREDGGKVLEYKAGGAIAAAPWVENGVVYVGTFSKKFHAVGPNGRATWTFPADNWFWGQALLAKDSRVGDVIFVGSLDGSIYALDAASGRVRWSFKAEQGIRAKPVLACKGTGSCVSLTDQVLVVGSRDGMVYGFDPITGNASWEQPFDAGGRVLAPLVAEGNVVYGANTDHTLFALDASTGAAIWRSDE